MMNYLRDRRWPRINTQQQQHRPVPIELIKVPRAAIYMQISAAAAALCVLHHHLDSMKNGNPITLLHPLNKDWLQQ